MHPPAREILDRRLADQFDESFGERRTRDPDFLCKRFDGPRPFRLRMKQCERGTHLGIMQACQPTAAMALCRKLQLPPQQLEEKRLGQSRQHGTIAGTRRRGFAHQVAHRRPPPLLLLRMRDRLHTPSGAVQRLERKGVFTRADAKNRRQRFQQRIEALIGVQKAADEARRRPAAAVIHDRDPLRGRLRIDVLYRDRRQLRIAGHYMLIAAREHDHVAAFDVDWRQCP